jgi:hypothetical protein
MKTIYSLLFLAALALTCPAVDITITAASVLSSTAASVSEGVAGDTITAGQPVYKDATDSGKIKLADANVLAKIAVVGISIHGAAAGQPIKYATKDSAFTLGGTVAAGAVVVLSATAGGIAPVTDLTSGSYGVVLGVGIGSNQIKLNPIIGGLVP